MITGTVYKADGRTPAPGVVIYAYHTNAAGIYPTRDEPGNAGRHGSLRAWLKSDDRGRYRFSTIRPGPYPEGTEAAHIHMTVLVPGGEEQLIDPIMFEDDPLLTSERRKYLEGRGGSGVIQLVQGKDGGWTGTRDIVLNRSP